MVIVKQHDVCVIGTGIAGLSAAYHLAKKGLDVAVITKSEIKESNTLYAQGGIAVAMKDGDTPQFHYEDTLRAGAGHCNPKMVKILVEEGPALVQDLIECGACFDSDEQGLSYTQEGAHSQRRILHAGDATGREIEKTLGRKVQTYPNVHFYDHTSVTQLVRDDHARCVGAVAISRSGEQLEFKAPATILATGGCSQVYLHNTNPPCATGDGLAMAMDINVELADMEFVQFHPTTLYTGDQKPISLFLISEAVRGEGALLRNVDGERFMPSYHPMAELAPRDVVSRAIYTELVRTSSSHVYLDLSTLTVDIATRFPTIYARCLAANIDMAKDWVPVSPAAHYMIGGIKTAEWGQTNVAGLYAAGEVASTGVHGANRLASNSLLEGLVFGERVARHVSDSSLTLAANNRSTPVMNAIDISFDFRHIKQKLRHWMWQYVGISRSKTGLETMQAHLESVDIDLSLVGTRNLAFNETRAMLKVAGQMTTAALTRTCSLGAHFRDDG